MAKTGLSTLIGNVGNILEIGTPGTGTDPTKAEITAWINEAQRDIARKVPWQCLKDLITCYNPSIAAVSVADMAGLVTDFYKFCYATLNTDGAGTDDKAMQLVNPEVAAMATTNSLIGTADSPIIWLSGTNINWLPATTGGAGTGKLKFYYIKEPTALNGDSDTTTLPEEFEDALVYYAAAMGRAQEEEWQQYGVLMQKYAAILQDIVNNYTRHLHFK